MIALLQSIIPKISGLYTLPWIVVGFIVTNLLAYYHTQDKVNLYLRKVALVLLYVFVPLLVFRIFLDTGIGLYELEFVSIVISSITFMYLLALALCPVSNPTPKPCWREKIKLPENCDHQNQGRLCFCGWNYVSGAKLGSFGGDFYGSLRYCPICNNPIHLHVMHDREHKERDRLITLPWFLRVYPYYFILYVVAWHFGA